MSAIETRIPAALRVRTWDDVAPFVDELLARSVATSPELEQWLVDRSELDAACAEARSILSINTTCNTEDQEAQAAYTRFIEQVAPNLKKSGFALDRRLVELAARVPLDAERFGVLLRDARASVEIFREENVPIQTELAKLGQKFDRVAGAMNVMFEGREQTLPEMARYQEVTDRSVREAAWRGVASRRLRDEDTLHEIFDESVRLRHRMALNAGFENYVGYAFKSKGRFDYTPADCFAFHSSVERAFVPLTRTLSEHRRTALGVESLRPWDVEVDPHGRPPLTPFSDGRDLVSKTRAALRRLDPRLDAMFARLGDGANTRGVATGECLDLDSRKGKAPGGYQAMRDRERKPFIFMNAAGRASDVRTMVHEAGHAFHSMLAEREPLLHYRHAPLEFAEVASMSMELLTMPHWGGAEGFYPESPDHARAARGQLEKILEIMPWIATIDAFQHWVYSNPRHAEQASGRNERAAAWVGILDRFSAGVSWTGLERERAALWQRQLHIFKYPFYYIEYGIAQLGALQLWVMALERGETEAIGAYTRGLTLGGSKPLPKLFAAAGLEFDFGLDTMRRLADRLWKELEKLPA
ncbi:MAG: M3 family oligoendopeptidase [Planctomycetota bacterium]|nr:M3 family oligoendopeptidase [Planctomycetota bacterium]